MTTKQDLKLSSIPNFRSLGGISTKDGYVIKPNLIFRSAALTALTNEEIAQLENLEVKTIVDFRSLGEVKANPDDVIQGSKYINISPNALAAREAAKDSSEVKNNSKQIDIESQSMEKYLQYPDNVLKDEMTRLISDEDSLSIYKEFLNLFKDSQNLPIIFHCRGGKDRAGIGALLILLVLGVSRENITKDYLLTEESNKLLNEKKMIHYAEIYDDQRILDLRKALMSAKKQYIDAAFDEIDRIANTTDLYLKNYLKLTESDIDAIKENALINFKSRDAK